METMAKPWPAVWALVLGFFMIMIDTTIVYVATPAIMTGLHTDINSVIWVTSAYLLAYAVPLLVTGRLGDRFGPKKLYLIGLVVFTLASLWCGFSGTIEMLIVARAVQGLGAALLAPQTMAIVTRIFPPDRRGVAMGLWGAVAGVASLVGPILGGVLVDSLGWEWIFFINVPVGVFSFVVAWRYLPSLATHPHRFDIFGVVLSAIGLFCLVFGIQEGQNYNWGVIVGPISVWGLILTGIVVLAGFAVWQRFNKGEPLLPLSLFRDRNFSLANFGITAVAFAVTSMSLPIMLYVQIVRGLTPTEAALLLVPMAVLNGSLGPLVGKLADHVHPRYLVAPAMLCLAVGLIWLGFLMTPDVPIWMLLFPIALLGVANGGMWSPLSTTATRNLPPWVAGAGAGVYNTTRQIGAVLGSAGIAVLMQALLVVQLPGASAAQTGGDGALPTSMYAGFSTAMGQSLLLPAGVALLGAIVVLFFVRPTRTGWDEQAPAVVATESTSPAAPSLAAPDPGSARL